MISTSVPFTGRSLLTVSVLAVLLLAVPARAEKADSDKPVNIEADRASMDDLKKVQIFEGNVQLVKGTLVIRAARIVVTQDENGFQRGVATGSDKVPPRFRQKREGVDEYVEGEALRIEHDANAEKTEFFERAWVRSGQDEVRGQFISYDARTERYLVTSSSPGARPAPPGGERVRAVIQPKNKDKAASPPAPSLPLKADPILNHPRQETAQ